MSVKHIIKIISADGAVTAITDVEQILPDSKTYFDAKNMPYKKIGYKLSGDTDWREVDIHHMAQLCGESGAVFDVVQC